jgi:SAM-dependent methyltransferase
VSEWFEHWFGEEYLELYPHRDETEAARVVALLQEHDVVRSGAGVVDLACGAGRHALALARVGVRVVGIDLSMPLLRVAQRRWPESRLARADVRVLPLRSGSADSVVNLFTSFGYFEHDEQHATVLAEVARVLRPGGRFALDFLNAPQVRATLVPRDERQLGERRVVQERRLERDGRFVVKTIHLAGEGRSFLERVRLYERADLERMMRAAGLAIDEVLGDYDGGPHGPGTSRLILLATRP